MQMQEAFTSLPTCSQRTKKEIDQLKSNEDVGSMCKGSTLTAPAQDSDCSFGSQQHAVYFCAYSLISSHGSNF